jgi:uncharacterized membrane protein (DUF4010 family)
LLVILISGLSLVGYVLTRALGRRRGLALTALTGGLVSSTAVSLALAKRSREECGQSDAGPAVLVAILLAWTVMCARVVVLVAMLSSAMLPTLLVPFAAIGLATLGTGLALYRRSTRTASVPTASGPAIPLKNPFSLTSAGKFALLFAAVLLVVKGVEHFAPGKALYWVAGLAGLTDVDPIALSMANHANQGGATEIAVRAVTIAALANTVAKAGLVVALGHPSLRTRILTATGVILTFGIAALWAI